MVGSSGLGSVWASLVDFSTNFLSYTEKRWGREAPPLIVWQREKNPPGRNDLGD
jgi:hypothetical protein